MNRRLFAAGFAAFPGLESLLAQESTPVASPIAAPGEEGSAANVLRSFLERVIGEGDARAVDDFFDPDEWDLEDLYWNFADLQADARKRDEPFVLDIKLIFGDDWGAIAFGTFGAGSWTDRDFFMAINAEDGLIYTYRFMSDAA